MVARAPDAKLEEWLGVVLLKEQAFLQVRMSMHVHIMLARKASTVELYCSNMCLARVCLAARR
eukprot:4621229-Pleurochrysis_carterae.AAC.1